MDKLCKLIDRKASKEMRASLPKGILYDACCHALAGGKRIRSCIVLGMIQELKGEGYKFSKCDYFAAIAVEYLHNASLIIDDLPCMDNDLERRGNPTVHAKYGERVAQLASTSLMAAAISCLARAVESLDKSIGLFVIRFVVEKMGSSGASGGEMEELQRTDITVKEVIHMKTSTFFEIAMIIGWLFGGGDFKKINKVSLSARNLGMVYQIADDIEDVEQDQLAGSTVNYVIQNGLETAKEHFGESLAGVKIEMPPEGWC